MQQRSLVPAAHRLAPFAAATLLTVAGAAVLAGKPGPAVASSLCRAELAEVVSATYAEDESNLAMPVPSTEAGYDLYGEPIVRARQFRTTVLSGNLLLVPASPYHSLDVSAGLGRRAVRFLAEQGLSDEQTQGLRRASLLLQSPPSSTLVNPDAEVAARVQAVFALAQPDGGRASEARTALLGESEAATALYESVSETPDDELPALLDPPIMSAYGLRTGDRVAVQVSVVRGEQTEYPVEGSVRIRNAVGEFRAPLDPEGRACVELPGLSATGYDVLDVTFDEELGPGTLVFGTLEKTREVPLLGFRPPYPVRYMPLLTVGEAVFRHRLTVTIGGS